jgi:hypothetical protein
MEYEKVWPVLIAVSLTTFVMVKPFDVADPENGGCAYMVEMHMTKSATMVRNRPMRHLAVSDGGRC